MAQSFYLFIYLFHILFITIQKLRVKVFHSKLQIFLPMSGGLPWNDFHVVLFTYHFKEKCLQTNQSMVEFNCSRTSTELNRDLGLRVRTPADY